MSCKQCGETGVSGLCKFCAREKYREGDWKEHFQNTEGDD